MVNYSIEYLFKEFPLYGEVNFKEDENFRGFINELVLDPDLKADLYCTQCGKERIFFLDRNEFNPKLRNIDSEVYQKSDVDLANELPLGFVIKKAIRSPYFSLTLKCSNDETHAYALTINIKSGNVFTKIGQFPSLASLEKNDVEKYRKLLDKDYKYLTKAIGLYSHGVGIGSYVYLRRIFENLIEEKHQLALLDGKWDETVYQKARMNEKINLLKDTLPPIFKNAPSLYGVLSKGVHELSEEQCLEYFPILKLAIEKILDEKKAEIENQRKEQELLNEINKIASTIAD